MAKYQRVGIFCLAFVFCSEGPAYAFSLGDHELITRQAIQELRHCFGATLVRPHDEAAIISANRDEDTGLLNKWSMYSHYFHPEKKLRMLWRVDSSVRVSELSDELQGGHSSNPEAREQLGHLVHHIQDMASPPHVVPVTHWLTDGFESFESRIGRGSGSCGELLASTSYEELLRSTAESTLRRVREEKFEVRRNGAPGTLGWWAFWAESNDDGFGEYGYLGNSYGLSSIPTVDGEFEVSFRLYREFKEQQLRLAVEATKKALYLLYQ